MQVHEARSGHSNNRNSDNNSSSFKSNQELASAPPASLPGASKERKKVLSNNNNNSSNKKPSHQKDCGAQPALAMSNLSSYSLIDDDHIDDQETINVGNLIIDLESDLEKEKIENEQANAKPTTSSVATLNNNNVPTSTFGTKATSSSSSSANSTSNNINSSTTNSKSKSSRHSAQHTTALTNSSNNIVNSSSSSSGGTSSTNPGIATNSTSNSLPATSVGPTINSGSGNPGHLMPKRTVFKSSADERGELKMRITRETKPGKSEHKIVTSPNQKSPTSCSSSSSSSSSSNSSSSCSTTCNTAPTISQANNNCEDVGLCVPPTKPTQSTSSISSTKECGTSTSIGTITEPDCLGPCEPGTSVTLEGIVWQETEGGILVVNITWRGKTYVGSLLDCTKHDWAPPRLCDSPASDIDSKAHKGVRTKRIVTRSNGIGLDEKNLLQTTGKLRNGKGRRILNDPASCNKRQREAEKSDISANQPETIASNANVSLMTNSENTCVPMNVDTVSASANKSILTINNQPDDISRPSSPVLISCNEPNCSKKFRNTNGLQYHKAHAHGTENDLNNAHDSNCSSSAKPPIKEDNEEESKEVSTMETESLESNLEDKKNHNNDGEVLPIEQNRTPSPHLNVKMSGKVTPETSYSKPSSNNIAGTSSGNSNISNTNSSFSNTNINFATPDIRGPPPPPPPPPSSSLVRESDLEKRSLPNYMNLDREIRSPIGAPKLAPEYIPVSSNTSSSKNTMNNLKQSTTTSSSVPPPPPPPLPATSEEGIKPSGTSTGPPPAPHQANCYFNPAFLANSFSPYLGPYFPRSPLPMYDPLAPATSTANAAFLSRFMSTMRVPPPPDSPSKLMNPSAPKPPLPFPPFKMDPGSLPLPNAPMTNPPLIGIPPLPNAPMVPGSPHLRMPGHNDPIMPPTSQPPFSLPVGMNPVLGLPGHAHSLGPLGGPQVPSLVDDPLAKQFPRRFN